MCAVVKMDNNPTTALIIPIGKRMNKEYCNDCSHCTKEKQEGFSTRNFKCAYSTDKRVIRLKVYDEEKVDVPFWCPKKNKQEKKSMLSEEQQRKWDASRRKYEFEKKWREINGILGWDGIKEGETYHCPPSPFHGRMDVVIEVKYPGSLRAKDINTNKIVWLYKSDEAYKFMSSIKG